MCTIKCTYTVKEVVDANRNNVKPVKIKTLGGIRGSSLAPK